MWNEFELSEYVGKNLSELVNTKFKSSEYNMSTNMQYSEFIVYYSGNDNISSLLEKINSLLKKNNIDVKLSSRESENVFGSSKKYIIEVNGYSNEEVIAKILRNSKYFDEVNVNYSVHVLTNDVNYKKVAINSPICFMPSMEACVMVSFINEDTN